MNDAWDLGVHSKVHLKVTLGFPGLKKDEIWGQGLPKMVPADPSWSLRVPKNPSTFCVLRILLCQSSGQVWQGLVKDTMMHFGHHLPR